MLILISVNILGMVLDLTGKDFFSIGDDVGRNVIIFGVDMSSSSHIDNMKKDILIFGKGPSQGLEHTLTAEKLYSVNFTKKKQSFV